MNSGMYSALSGSIAAMKRLDIISNNLANVNTPGFKKDKMLFESMLNSNAYGPTVPNGSTADPILQKDSVYIDYSHGSVTQTGNVLDLAIDGDGFFIVNTPEGPAYTRQGNFRIAADGTLVTSDGHPVMGDGGPLILQGGIVDVNSEGMVKVDGSPVGTLSVVDFPKPYRMTKIGSALFRPSDAQMQPKPKEFSVRQGHLESSNVDAITEMVQMIETSRYFDSCQRVIRGFDDMAAKAVGELGKV
ncbi:MAG TPA: flagellar basal-body rod protein FlgF [Clostridia bacterium]|nr:flagellar basal-body rod protein FlgF [Clostridia bacterium]